jgi:hypothetical protein
VYQALETWGTTNKVKNKDFWKRLRGENTFCKKAFVPDAQVWHKTKEGQRYCGLNYAYSRYKTVELRLLPMFKDYKLSVGAVEAFIQFTNEFLLRSSRRTKIEEILLEPIGDLFKKDIEILISTTEYINAPESFKINLSADPGVLRKKSNDPQNSITYLRSHVAALVKKGGV